MATKQPATQNKTASQRKQNRRRLLKIQRFIFLCIAVALMLGLTWLITRLITPNKAEPQPDAQPLLGAEPSPLAAAPTYTFVGPVKQPPESMTFVQPDYSMMTVPENGRIDMEYFKTAAFIGDSITQGMYEFAHAGIPQAHFMAYIGVGPKGIYDGTLQERGDKDPRGPGEEVPFEALQAANPDNVYILLGTNIMVNEERDDIIITYYRELIKQLKQLLRPDVGIYIQSITSVREGIDSRFDINRIQGLNRQLASMAWEEGVYFVDIGAGMNREDGYIQDSYGADKDGYHLTASGYTAWKEYLITHTVYNPRHEKLYLENSNIFS